MVKLNSRLRHAGPKKAAPPLKLDLGCGPHKKEGFTGVDAIAFPGVDVVTDLRKPWPWKDSSVAEVHSSHFVEHLWNTDDRPERVHFANELYRVLAPGGTAKIIVPHWCSTRAYGDFTHAFPPVSEFWLFYLKREWRKANAPHNDIEHCPHGYDCDFEPTWGYSLEQGVAVRNQEYQRYAMSYLKEACQDTLITLISLKK